MARKRLYLWLRCLIGSMVVVVPLAAALSFLHLPASAADTADTEGHVGKVRWAYYVPYAPNSLESLRQNIDNLNYLSPYWYHLDGEGLLVSTGELEDKNKGVVLRLARSKGVRILPMVKNSATYDSFTPVLADDALRRKAIDNIVRMTVASSFDGVHIDFEGLNPEDRPHLTTFMAELSVRLRSDGKLVTQAVAAKDMERTTGWAGAYDYAGLGAANDLIVLMTYGYGTAVPQSTAPFPWVEGSVAYASSLIPPQKLLLGLAWYGFDWNLTAGGVTPLRHSEALALTKRYGAVMDYDEVVQSPYFSYTASGEAREVWFEDGRSNDAKLDLVFRYGLAGAAGWRLGHEDSDVWSSFRDRLAFRTWYLAEGATTPPFDTWILIQNPNPYPVDTTVTFLLEDGATEVFRYRIEASSRFSLYANELVPDIAFATKVEAKAPVFVERAMYFGYDGHVSVGVNSPSRNWYLPEGSSKGDTDTWVLLMNPNSLPAEVSITYMKDDGTTLMREVVLRPTSRLNVYANQDVPDSVFSTWVEADMPIVVERASYYGEGKYGHGSPGSPFTAPRWYLAAGYTGHRVSLAVMNPNGERAQARLTFMLENGENIHHTISLPPFGRRSFVVNRVLPADTPFSTVVEGDRPLVVERTSYLANGAAGNGAQSALGTLAPARSWLLPEGSTAAPFQTDILLQNPHNFPVRATVTFMPENGANVAREYELSPMSRLTVPASPVVPDTAFSTRVDSSLPIVVERSMYFGRGSHSSAGVGQ